MWTFLFKVESFDDGDTHTTFHAVRAETFAEATEQIESYYGNSLCGFKVDCLEDYHGEISETEYERMLREW